MKVTDHALDRAQRRYGLVNIDKTTIERDVADAIQAGRASRLHPNGSGYEIRDSGFYAWTPDRLRIYVVACVTSRRRRFLRVLTAIPGCYGDPLPEARKAAA